MGEELVRYFHEAERIGGLQGKVRLAMLALIASQQARIIPDAPENIHRLQRALEELKMEMEKEKQKEKCCYARKCPQSH